MGRSLWLLILFCSVNSYSANQTLVLIGHDNYEAFGDSAQAAFEVSQKSGREVAVVGGKNKDLNSGRKLESIQDVKSWLHLAAKKMNTNDTLVVYLVDHGLAPKNYNEPLTSSLALQTNWFNRVIGKYKKIRYKELMEALQQEIPKTNKIQLIANSCFSGAVHTISRIYKNVCSASNTDHASVFYFLAQDYDQYGTNLWQGLEASRNLFESQMYAVYGDLKNGNRGVLSSEDYIDWVQKKGAYDKSNWKALNGPMSLPRYNLSVLQKWAKNPSDGSVPKSFIDEVNKKTSREISSLSLPLAFNRSFSHWVRFWNNEKDRITEVLTESFPQRYQQLKKEKNEKSLTRLSEVTLSLVQEFEMHYASIERFHRIIDFVEHASEKDRAEVLRLLECESSGF